MTEAEFKSKMLYAESMKSYGERLEYWEAYIRGLERRFHGNQLVKEDEHCRLIEDIRSDDQAKAERGRGYRNGLTELSVTHATCLRCGHSWYPRIHTESPRVCPNCHSQYWDRPRTRRKGKSWRKTANDYSRSSRKEVSGHILPQTNVDSTIPVKMAYSNFQIKEVNILDPITVKNNDADIVETNYWETPLANNGDCYLSIYSWTFRLLVPDAFLSEIEKWKTATEVIVSRGPREKTVRKDAIEILFEDNSDNPYALHIVAEQVDHMPLPADQDRPGQPARWTFAVWTRQGKVLEFPGRFRKVREIPWLKSF